MHYRRPSATALLAVLLCLAAGCGKNETGSQSQSRVRMSVRASHARRRELVKSRRFAGVLEPFRRVDLSPSAPAGARVVHIPVEVGDYVRRGTAVAKMDDARLIALVARFQPLKARYARSQRLLAHNALSEAEFEQVEAEYIALKREVESLEENTTLKAPFSGFVTHIGAEEGEMFSAQAMGMTPGPSGLVRITQLDPLRLDLEVDDKTVSVIRKGMEVEVVTDVLPDTTFTGEVAWVNPSADPVSHTFEVRLRVPNPDQLLKAGYFAEVRIVLRRKDDALAVPASAVVDDRVYIVTDSIAVSVPVETGWRTDEHVEIVSGIAENSLVVISGNKALPDSALVNVVE